jgi:hypothetical protein
MKLKFRMEKYDEWKERKRLHREQRHERNRSRGVPIDDWACMECYRVRTNNFTEETMRKFRIFWDTWGMLVPVETYNRNTVKAFQELINEDKTGIQERRDMEITQITRVMRNIEMIIESVNYREKLEYSMEGCRNGIWTLIFKDARLYMDTEGNIEDEFVKRTVEYGMEQEKYGYVIKLDEAMERFSIFWEWYSEITTARNYRREALEIFRKLCYSYQDELSAGEKRREIRRLRESIEYRNINFNGRELDS